MQAGRSAHRVYSAIAFSCCPCLNSRLPASLCASAALAGEGGRRTGGSCAGAALRSVSLGFRKPLSRPLGRPAWPFAGWASSMSAKLSHLPLLWS